MKKVKSLLFKAKFEGNGVVNFDSSDQKYMWNQLSNKERSMHDNVSFAKKNWYNNEKNELSYKLKISSDCLRHQAFVNDFQFQSPNIINNDVLFLTSIASPASLLRGYLFADKELTIKKTSSLTITDAVQTCNAVSSLETFSRSGKKVTDENKSDTSFFKKETVGEIYYSAEGGIDFKELQFLSLDQIFDRLSINPDSFPIYKELLKTKLPSFNSEPKYYQIIGSCNRIPEYGVLFSNEDVVCLTKEMLKRILSINIQKSKSFAKIIELKIKFLYDCTEDKMSDESGWITISNKENIDSLNFEVENFFEEENKEAAEILRKKIEEAEIQIKQKNKEEGDKKKAESKARKEESAKKKAEENKESTPTEESNQ